MLLYLSLVWLVEKTHKIRNINRQNLQQTRELLITLFIKKLHAIFQTTLQTFYF